jgi:hypothetical protein
MAAAAAAAQPGSVRLGGGLRGDSERESAASINSDDLQALVGGDEMGFEIKDEDIWA